MTPPEQPADAVPAAANPGSDEALARGCLCPVIENGHGKTATWPPDGWWMVPGCPVHLPHRKTA
jgi:hypothetical protein